MTKSALIGMDLWVAMRRGDALDLYFGTGEAGEIAADVEIDAVGHGRIRILWFSGSS